MLRIALGIVSILVLGFLFATAPDFLRENIRKNAERYKENLKVRCDDFSKDEELKRKMTRVNDLQNKLTRLEADYRRAKNAGQAEQLREIGCNHALLIKDARQAHDEAHQSFATFDQQVKPVIEKIRRLRLKRLTQKRQPANEQEEKLWQDSVKADLEYAMASIDQQVVKPLQQLNNLLQQVEWRSQKLLKLQDGTTVEQPYTHNALSASVDYLESVARKP